MWDFIGELRGCVLGAACGEAVAIGRARWAQMGPWGFHTRQLLATLEHVLASGGLEAPDLPACLREAVGLTTEDTEAEGGGHAGGTRWAYAPDADRSLAVPSAGATSCLRALAAGHALATDDGGAFPRAVVLAPCGCTYTDMRAAQAATNSDPMSGEGGLALGRVARRLMMGFQPVVAVEAARQESVDGLTREVWELRRPFVLVERMLWDAGRGTRPARGRVGGMQMASEVLWSLVDATDFANAVGRACSLGGDVTLRACVTGALAGLYFNVGGIPDEWMRGLEGRRELARVLALASTETYRHPFGERLLGWEDDEYER